MIWLYISLCVIVLYSFLNNWSWHLPEQVIKGYNGNSSTDTRQERKEWLDSSRLWTPNDNLSLFLWKMKLLSYYPSYLKSHDRQVNFSVTGKESITPSFKKRKKERPGKYRQISPTSVPCKIMEKILLKNMLRHMEKQDFWQPMWLY